LRSFGRVWLEQTAFGRLQTLRRSLP